jgi:hypothetical protein
MTDGHDPRRGSSAGAGAQLSGTARRRGRRQTHPLLAPFPLIVMALATFLVLLALMAARMRTQAVSALAPSSRAGQIARTGAHTIRTTASGHVITATASSPAGGAAGLRANSPAVVTASSGSRAAGAPDD